MLRDYAKKAFKELYDRDGVIAAIKKLQSHQMHHKYPESKGRKEKLDGNLFSDEEFKEEYLEVLLPKKKS